MVKFCSECGSQLSEESRFCEECGAFIGEVENLHDNNIEKPVASSDTGSDSPISSRILSIIPFIKDHFRIITLVGVLLLFISLFIPAHLYMNFFYDESNEMDFTWDVQSTFTQILSGDKDIILYVIPLIIAILLALYGLKKNVTNYVCIAGIVSGVSYWLTDTYLEMFTLSIYNLIIIIAIIIATIAYLKGYIKLFIVSAGLWIFYLIFHDVYRFYEDYMYTVLWSYLFIIGSLCLLLAGGISLSRKGS